MWIVDELKEKGFVVGAEVKYVRGERTYRIVNITKQGLVAIRIINHEGKLGTAYEKQPFMFLRSADIVLRTQAASQVLPYANRS